MNITQKKEWLGRYAYYYDLCMDRRDQRESILNISASRLSLAPKGQGGGSGMEKLIIKRSKIEDELYQYVQKMNEVHAEISQALNKLEDHREARVLRLRYLNLKDWPEIRDIMDLSRSSIYTLYNRALKHLDISGVD